MTVAPGITFVFNFSRTVSSRPGHASSSSIKSLDISVSEAGKVHG